MNKIITLSLVAATLLFTACGEKTDEKTAKAIESTKTAAHDIAEASKEAANKAREAVIKASAEAKIAADKAIEATKEAADKAMEEAKEAADKAMEEAKEAVEKTENAVKAGTTAAIDSLADNTGKEAYAKCAGCHGVDGKTKALGKSAEIGGVDKATLVEMLKAYKAGTRNQAGMGMLMKGQIDPMDDATIEAVATYISTLK